MFGQSRSVKYGDKGRRVKQIQHSLAKLGYEVGVADGEFGLVTEEAVQAFQRDFQLTPDGIVGAKTAALLNSRLESKFLIHRVKPEEDLRTISNQYALSPRVIIEINKLPDFRVSAGQVLRIPKRLVVGFCSSASQPAESLFRHVNRLDAVISAGLALTAQNGLVGSIYLREDLQNWVKQHQIELWLAIDLPSDRSELENLLFVRKNLDRAIHEVARAVRSVGSNGVVVMMPTTVLARHRFYLNRFFKRLSASLPELQLAAALPLPTDSRAISLDYQDLARWCRWILLQPEPTTTDFRSGIRRVLREVGCWQILLGLHSAPSTRRNRECISLVNKYNLGGAVILGFGREGESIWASLREEFLSGDINSLSDS